MNGTLTVDLGGVMLTPESISPTPDSKTESVVTMLGSVMIFEARTLAEVEMTIKEDVYYTSGVVSSFLPFFFASIWMLT
jgi:hypothetical protein